MRLSEAWLAQSKSDWEASGRVFIESDHATYCQTISKCQQTVEKSIKGVVSALDEAGILTMDVGWKHEVGKFVSAFRLPPQKKQPETARDILSNLREFFSMVDIDSGIRQLDGLAPRRPPPGEPLPRNTEYPFDGVGGSYCVPADANTFTLGEVKRYQDIATRIYIRCSKTVTALKLLQ